MSNKPLHDGSKIYDTPKCGTLSPVYAGYNGGCESYPTHGVGSAWKETAYWERKLFNRVCSVFNFTIPEHWDRDYTLWILFRCGYFGVINAKNRIDGRPDFGVIPQYAVIGGHNVFFQPTYLSIGNSLIKRDNYRIGVNAGVVKLTPDYEGVWDLIHYHAEKLAILSQALDMSILNSRVAFAYLAETNAQAQTFYTLFDSIDQGNPVVAVNAGQVKLDSKGKPPYFELHNEVGRNYIVDKLQDAIEKQLQEFDRDIGIPTLSDKKERQLTNEVVITAKSALTAIDVWYDTLTRSIKECEKVFPDLGFKVEKPGMEVQNNEPANQMES